MTAAPPRLDHARHRRGAAHRRRGRRRVLGEGGRPAEPARVAADRPARRRAHPDRERSRAGQDDGRPRRRRIHPRRLPAHPVHARPAAQRHHRHPGLRVGDQLVRHPARPGAHQHRAARRDQPLQRQDAERDAGGDGGTPDHHRGHGVSDPGAVPGDRHPEPGRPGGHLSALGGADRPVHAQGRPVATPPPTKRSR